MIRRVACLAALCATTAAADPQATVHMYSEPLGNGAVGEIRHTNQLGNPGVRTFYLETPYGEVHLRIDVTINSFCDTPCPDTLEVLSLPMLLVAIPHKVTTGEGETGVIVLYLWEGV